MIQDDGRDAGGGGGCIPCRPDGRPRLLGMEGHIAPTCLLLPQQLPWGTPCALSTLHAAGRWGCPAGGRGRGLHPSPVDDAGGGDGVGPGLLDGAHRTGRGQTRCHCCWPGRILRHVAADGGLRVAEGQHDWALPFDDLTPSVWTDPVK